MDLGEVGSLCSSLSLVSARIISHAAKDCCITVFGCSFLSRTLSFPGVFQKILVTLCEKLLAVANGLSNLIASNVLSFTVEWSLLNCMQFFFFSIVSCLQKGTTVLADLHFINLITRTGPFLKLPLSVSGTFKHSRLRIEALLKM